MSKRNIQKSSQQQNNLKKAFNDINNLEKAKFTSYYSQNVTEPAFIEKEPEQQPVNNESDEQNQTLSQNIKEGLNYRFEAIESRFSENIAQSIAQIKETFRKELSDYKISTIKWIVIILLAFGGIIIASNYNSLYNLEKNFNEEINSLDNSISNIIEHLE